MQSYISGSRIRAWITGLMIIIVCLSGGAWAVGIHVTSEPELGTTNYLTNSDFEQGVSGPQNWRFTTGRADLLSGHWSDTAFRGQKSVAIEAVNGDMSGYWGQDSIAVKPGENLLLSAWVKLEQGRVLMYAIGLDNRSGQRKQVYNDRRLYLSSASDNPLYPVFVKPDLLRGLLGPEWQRQRFLFQNAPEVNLVNLRLGLYFGSTPGEVRFDRAYFGPPWVTLSVNVSGEDIQRIEILDDLGITIHDTKALGGRTQWSGTLQIPADLEYCEIVVTDGDGRVTKMRYPQER
ncbi:MAG: carbohydrate binding domain-containing protein [Limnochordia bacterium]